jgi:hypothetical protein
VAVRAKADDTSGALSGAFDIHEIEG